MMDLEEWQWSGEYFQYDGHDIFFRSEGSGPPLLLIHGFPTASWDWIKIWPELSNNYQCITLDLLGYGFSSKPRQPYLISQQADICEALLRHLGITSCHIVAHDYGGTVAQELLARQQDTDLDWEIKTLHLLNGGLFPETHFALLTQKLLISPIGGVLARFISRRGFAKSLKRIFGADTPPSEAEITEYWKLVQYNQGQMVMPLLLDYINQRKTNRERWVSALISPKVNVKLTAGLDDPVSGAHMVARYRELVAESNVLGLSGIGHYPQVEAPKAVLASITSHLGSYQED